MAVSANACPRPSTAPQMSTVPTLPWKALSTAMVAVLIDAPMRSGARGPSCPHRPPAHRPTSDLHDAVGDEQRAGRADGEREAVPRGGRRLSHRRQRRVGHEDPAADAQRPRRSSGRPSARA